MWRAETLRGRLAAVAEACREWEGALAGTGVDLLQEGQAATGLKKLHDAALEAAANKISTTIKEHALTFDIVVSEGTGVCGWTLFMRGILVAKGQASHPDDLFTAAFYENEMKSLEVSRYYQRKYFP